MFTLCITVLHGFFLFNKLIDEIYDYLLQHGTHISTVIASTQCTALLSEEDRATATVSTCRKFHELWMCGF